MNDEQRDQEYKRLEAERDELHRLMNCFIFAFEKFSPHDPQEAQNILIHLLRRCLNEKEPVKQPPEAPLNPDDLPF